MGLLQVGVGIGEAGWQMLCGHELVTKPLRAEVNFHQAEERGMQPEVHQGSSTGALIPLKARQP